MPAGTRQLKRRNHTVNKSYLLRFADDRACLTSVTLPGEVRVPVSVNDATVVRNFYVVQLDDGSESSGCHSMPGPAKHIKRGSAGPAGVEGVSQGIRLRDAR